MTRLFPHPYEGLHEAFPPSSDPRFWPGPASGAPFVGGLIGLAGFSLTWPFTSFARAAAVSTKCAAYGCLAAGCLGVVNEVTGSIRAQAFLAEKGITKPPQRLYDQLGTFGFDDAAVLGGLGAVLIATRLRRPWGVTGWRRWTGAVAVGNLTATYAWMAYYSGGKIDVLKELAARQNARREQADKYRREVVQHTWLFGPKGDASSGQIEHKLPQIPPSTTTPTMLGKVHPDYQPNTETTTLSENEGPHITAHEEGETESTPIAARNYTWTVSPERVVPELETHIEALRLRRQELAQEAELLWHWLAEKEGEYSQLRQNAVGLDAEQEKQRLHFYLRALGVQHTNVWLAVSKMDWAIADAQKRIAQHHASVRKDDKGQFTAWMPQPPSPAHAQPPKTVLKSLSKMLNEIEGALRMTDQTLEFRIKELEGGGDLPGPLALPPHLKAKLLADPNWRDVLREFSEVHKQGLRVEKEAIEAVMRDGEHRVKKLQGGSGDGEKRVRQLQKGRGEG